MTPSLKLFYLIKSLDKHEKTYFKLYCSNGGRETSGYVKLFDAINNQKEYDEEKIKRHFKGHSFINRLSAVKGYIYDSILQSLCLFYSGKTLDGKISETINFAQALYNKGLWEQCESMLLKAKELVLSNERFPLALEVLKLEQGILANKLNAYSLMEDFKKLYAEEKQMLKKHENVCAYKNLYNQIFNLSNMFMHSRKVEHHILFCDIMKDPLLKNIESALSFDAQLLFYKIKISFYGRRSPNQSLHFTQQLIELFEKGIIANPNRARQYVHTLFSKVNLETSLGKYFRAEETIEKIKTIHEKFPWFSGEANNIYLFRIISLSEINLHVSSGDFAKGVLAIKQTERGLKRFGSKIEIHYRTVLYLNFSQIYFWGGEYKLTLKWLNKVLDAREGAVLPDTYCEAKLLNVMVHFELDNLDYLEHARKAIFRYFKTRDRLYKVEACVLDFVQSIVAHPELKKEKRHWYNFRSKLQKLSTDPLEKKFLDSLHIISWVDGKMAGRNSAEMVRKGISNF